MSRKRTRTAMRARTSRPVARPIKRSARQEETPPSSRPKPRKPLRRITAQQGVVDAKPASDPAEREPELVRTSKPIKRPKARPPKRKPVSRASVAPKRRPKPIKASERIVQPKPSEQEPQASKPAKQRPAKRPKARPTARPKARPTARPIKREEPMQEPPKASEPAKRPTARPKARTPIKRPAKPAKRLVVKDDRPIISLDIERGNRMAIRWPTQLEALTEALTYDVGAAMDEDRRVAIIGNLIGKIEELKDGVSKKLTPLNFINAHQVLSFIKMFGKIKNPLTGEGIYQTKISKEFATWFQNEAKAKKLAGEAYKLLEYDEATLHERWDDATRIVEKTPKGDVVKIGFPDINVPLYPWQAVGMQFLNTATRQGKGAFVCDETGLGKTYTLLAHLKRQKHKAVIVVPATLMEGWMRKIKHAIAEPLPKNPADRDPDKYYGTAIAVDKHLPLDADEKYDIIVISYAMLKRKGVWPICNWIEEQQRVLVLDESHYSKNYDSIRTTICLALSLRARHSIVMTATPLKNRILELHPQLRITRRLWTEASLHDFVKIYSGEEARKEIAEHLQGIMIRRMAGGVWTNPPKQQITEAWVGLSNEDDYRQVEKNFIKWLIENGASDDRVAAAERNQALVQLNKLRHLSAEGKVEEAIKILDKTLSAGEQCIIFCAFNSPLEKINRHFANKRGLNYKGQRWRGSGLITGKIAKDRRQVSIDAFMAGKLGLLCIGTGAGGLGIDLPIAAYGYFLDLPWTPADIEQGTGRLMRLGQERDCTFAKILAPRTIDQRMEALIQIKAEIFRDAIGDKDAVARVTTSNVMQENMLTALLADYRNNPYM